MPIEPSTVDAAFPTRRSRRGATAGGSGWPIENVVSRRSCQPRNAVAASWVCLSLMTSSSSYSSRPCWRPSSAEMLEACVSSILFGYFRRLVTCSLGGIVMADLVTCSLQADVDVQHRSRWLPRHRHGLLPTDADIDMVHSIGAAHHRRRGDRRRAALGFVSEHLPLNRGRPRRGTPTAGPTSGICWIVVATAVNDINNACETSAACDCCFSSAGVFRPDVDLDCCCSLRRRSFSSCRHAKACLPKSPIKRVIVIISVVPSFVSMLLTSCLGIIVSTILMMCVVGAPGGAA